MDKSLGLPSALAWQAMKLAHAPPARSAGVTLIGARPPFSTGPASSSPSSSSPSSTGPASTGPASTGPASSSPFPADHHDWLAQRMNDVVVRRIFAAGLDLQAALGLIDDHGPASGHRAALKICHATDELDHAIRDIRDILFDRGPR